MKTLIREKKSTKTYVVVQLLITLVALYISNRLSVDIWRSMTGH